ncbi:HAD family hydrolase [Alicyclobacillus mali]|uniref:HAD family hydrolase n=1 Tax=Alicyclobacillus mali (ex Roth et al. 2021) TaxID=1123961 RepID=A0ABS0F2J5_9BACL|nr:HAD family hydrolase [Alicyclobacillus mali (ex Roth et al. 2021)]MBF8377524.1 HAD family hydrolase [Alicyclobacillus mali (ex Roth et al. 2021)]MCL6489309.1 HAD hydrolase-like protein [Alicyclobacillus mali (ex Roth et al. 2021)]
MFRTILFDVDGVMLSEERYFDASALTVHELLTSPRFLGLSSVSPAFSPAPAEDAIRAIRRDVFRDDAVLEGLKNIGVNANWDMVYFVFVAEWIAALERAREASAEVVDRARAVLREGFSEASLRAIGELLREALPGYVIAWKGYDALYEGASSRSDLMERAREALARYAPKADAHALWQVGQETFQEWYLGDAYTGKATGKAGFLTSEYPIVDPAALAALLADLKAAGVTLGIATGRPEIETRVPLEHFGWLSYFDPACVTNASDVVAAEERAPHARPLSKPHPFSYLRSLMGEADVEKLLTVELPIPGIRGEVLVVGDSIADKLAADRLGASFAAVLTGLEGQAARPKFERLGADFILNHVLELRQVLSLAPVE